jgi:hypothetical protein
MMVILQSWQRGRKNKDYKRTWMKERKKDVDVVNSQVKTRTMIPEIGPPGGPGSGEMLATYRREAMASLLRGGFANPQQVIVLGLAQHDDRR